MNLEIIVIIQIINMPNQLQGDSTNYNIESYKIKIFQDDFFKESIENPFQNKDQIEITIKNATNFYHT